MIKRLCAVFLAIAAHFPSFAYSGQTVSVVVLPFEVHAREELSYLQRDIPEALSKILIEEGANTLRLDANSLPSWKQQRENTTEIRKIGLQTGAQYVVWGSLTWIGQHFSVDVRLLLAATEAKPALFSKTGQGVENLPATVTEIGKEISLAVFKREKIVEVLIRGNDRIEADAIRRVIKTKPDDIYNLKNLSQDLKAIYAMGYFDDIRIDMQTNPQGKIVTFEVVEKPTLRNVSIGGNIKVFDDEEIKEVLTMRTGAILNIFKIKNDIGRIEELYKEKNYHNVNVNYEITPRKKNQADLEFIIEEGQKLRITKIRFEGNQTYTDGKLKGLMTTSESNFLSWFTSAGDLIQQNLDGDVAHIKSFYQDNGYIQAKVGEPQINYKENDIEIVIRIDEGPQFRVGDVAVAGDLIVPETQLLDKVKISKEEFYSRKTLRNDVIALTDLYANEGYANVEISPRIDDDEQRLVVHITFDIKKGDQVYFEEITIGGNSKTRDKVIRRELRVYEQELFSAEKLKRSMRNLHRLDFFQDIKVNTASGSAEDQKILKIDVTEKSTGAFQFGAGFGNVENFFGVASVSERNLLGRGQKLSLEAKLGAKTMKFTLSFTEPWLFDIPLSAGVDIYLWNYAYPEYDKDSKGGTVRVSYPLFDYTRGYLSYNLDLADVTNIDDNAANSIKELEGTNLKSSIQASVGYDSRDSLFYPTEGSDHSISVEYAGLGGDIGFIKYIGETAWYYDLFWKFIGIAHGKAGYVMDTPGLLLPDYDKFYLGGIDSLRGFSRDDLAPIDDNGDEVGGESFVQFNFELRFPLVKEAGVYGVLFYDAGNVYGEDKQFDITDLRMSAGPGIKWLSPMGPINLFYGFILDPEPTDDASGKFVFSMATSF